MFDLGSNTKDCEKTLDELERVSFAGEGTVSAGEILEEVSAEARAHVARCAGCREAVEQFAETRNLLRPLTEKQAEPGPWFVTRVMAAIAAREQDEEREGVWVNVRRLGPRLVAVCTLLLVLGGTWAIRVRHTEVEQSKADGYGEALFEPGGAASFNDDVMIGVSSNEVRQ
jgi:hypothetical protein